VAISPDRVLRRLRSICMAQPATLETTSFGHPAFCIGEKVFVVLQKYKGHFCIVFKAEPLHQQELVESGTRFLVAPYIGKDGWVSMVAEGKLDWDEVRSLVSASHRLVGAHGGKAARRSPRPVTQGR
jgi:predicted DNA-binding protein (MmcQ/YjbR family)